MRFKRELPHAKSLQAGPLKFREASRKKKGNGKKFVGVIYSNDAQTGRWKPRSVLRGAFLPHGTVFVSVVYIRLCQYKAEYGFSYARIA
jgi:hypothetical protein